MARSVSAQMVRLGLTPRLAAITEPSQTYRFRYPNRRWRESTTPHSADAAIVHPPRMWAVPGTSKRISVTMLIGVPPIAWATWRANSLACGMKVGRSEEHTSELQSLRHLVCRLLLAKK